MNLPNKLTMLRVSMIPLFLIFFFWDIIPLRYLWALVVFAAASLTDLIDGKIARKRGLVTDFGKLMDPLADKLLVTAAFCCLLPGYGALGVISLVVILSREFLVTSIRLVAAGKGTVLAADIWGKIKTAVQMVWICLVLLGLSFPLSGTIAYAYDLAVYILFLCMLIVTVFSGTRYVIANRKLFADA